MIAPRIMSKMKNVIAPRGTKSSSLRSMFCGFIFSSIAFFNRRFNETITKVGFENAIFYDLCHNVSKWTYDKL